MKGWKTLSGVKIGNLQEWIKEVCGEDQAVHIGTDSLQTGLYTQFVTVVAVLTPGKGGRVAFKREVVKRIDSLRERLLKETWMSVDLGLKLTPDIPGDLTVHIDANPVQVHKSSRYVQELTAMVVSQGFNALLKPKAWAASHCADWLVRHKGQKLGKKERNKAA